MGGRPIDDTDLAQDPLAQRTALAGSQALGRGEACQAPPDSRPAEDVGDPLAADPPAAEALPGPRASAIVRRSCVGCSTAYAKTASTSGSGSWRLGRSAGRGFGRCPASPS